MWIDFIILAPVLAFLLWLFWYTRAPDGLSRIDRVVLVIAPVMTGTVMAVIHWSLDIEGMGLNVIAVAAGYLLASLILGAGWVWRIISRVDD